MLSVVAIVVLNVATMIMVVSLLRGAGGNAMMVVVTSVPERKSRYREGLGLLQRH